MLGGRLTWYAETDRHARAVLEHHWPGVPNLGDIRTVDWSGVAPVDILTAGFPCQAVSSVLAAVVLAGTASSRRWSDRLLAPAASPLPSRAGRRP
ncbi:DNA cytosine methyltransferase [Micromonospora sp. DT47]|uniref:DNA cytosine methyltransferase n=1 Tax=Micromonospora sp. DT47 TaxID=3393431 RepID=UPI003CEC5703